MGSKDAILQLTVFVLLTLHIWADPASHPVKEVVGKMDELRQHIASLTKSVETLEEGIEEIINPEDCSVGINNPYCSLASLDKLLHQQEVLSSHTMPGKRSRRETNEAERVNRVINDLSRKQEFLRSLKKMLNEADINIQTEKKRSCNFNLGFHCQTDEYSNIVDMYDFFNSAMSPGKRRKRSQLKNSAHKHQ
ncbi:uncharacterized protein LOC121381696 [Gigantopelta aegis]|uniref:uncharacterized protein LOC121381696 n=1 Tax=Gigantopelta aegis TaxID=1735272 RepID=UPI001B88A4B4|nr:uncharacterized protein LOC121381696 [Gigantopelta aegis]